MNRGFGVGTRELLAEEGLEDAIVEEFEKRRSDCLGDSSTTLKRKGAGRPFVYNTSLKIQKQQDRDTSYYKPIGPYELLAGWH